MVWYVWAYALEACTWSARYPPVADPPLNVWALPFRGKPGPKRCDLNLLRHRLKRATATHTVATVPNDILLVRLCTAPNIVGTVEIGTAIPACLRLSNSDSCL